MVDDIGFVLVEAIGVTVWAEHNICHDDGFTRLTDLEVLWGIDDFLCDLLS